MSLVSTSSLIFDTTHVVTLDFTIRQKINVSILSEKCSNILRLLSELQALTPRTIEVINFRISNIFLGFRENIIFMTIPLR